MGAPGDLRGVELEVLGWSTDQWSGETAVICRLLDGSSGEVLARWTDVSWRARPEARVGGVGSRAGWRLLLARVEVASDGFSGYSRFAFEVEGAALRSMTITA